MLALFAITRRPSSPAQCHAAPEKIRMLQLGTLSVYLSANCFVNVTHLYVSCCFVTKKVVDKMLVLATSVFSGGLGSLGNLAFSILVCSHRSPHT